eukprot:COSAG02_NODE_31792_length_527_cov_0.906542_1_plen_72_part_10
MLVCQSCELVKSRQCTLKNGQSVPRAHIANGLGVMASAGEFGRHHLERARFVISQGVGSRENTCLTTLEAQN